MDCFFSEDKMVCQRSSVIVEIISKKNPELITPFIGKMVAVFHQPKHHTQVRNVLRVFQHIALPEKYEGEVYEICFQFICSPQVPVAIRAFSITVCYHISTKYTALQNELIQIINSSLENAKPGFKSRAKIVLKELRN